MTGFDPTAAHFLTGERPPACDGLEESPIPGKVCGSWNLTEVNDFRLVVTMTFWKAACSCDRRGVRTVTASGEWIMQPSDPYRPPSPPPLSQPQPPVNVNVHNHVQPYPGYAPPVIVHNSNNAVHIVHLVLTLVTCGLWAPIWIIHAIVMAATDRPQQVYL
ncbi:hypothetical protein E1298_46250, partial [Actinomadura rubrisoli]